MVATWKAALLVVLLTLIVELLAKRSYCLRGLVEVSSGFEKKPGFNLGIHPTCGLLDSDHFGNINTGVFLSQNKVIYTFGDSYTSNGNYDGGIPSPAKPNKTNPNYGGRFSNGPTYPEYLAPSGATIRNFAVGGATVDRKLWLRRRNSTDMISHVYKFLEQHNEIEKTSTMAIIFYGINDMGSRLQGPGTMQEAAKVWLEETELLIEAGLNQFIIISVPDDEKDSREYCDIIWNGMKIFMSTYGIKFAYVDLMALWRPLLQNPSIFGFKNSSSCLENSKTIVGSCTDPQDYVFWTPGHPQTITHMLIADWIKEVLKNCYDPKSTETVYQSDLSLAFGDPSL